MNLYRNTSIERSTPNRIDQGERVQVSTDEVRDIRTHGWAGSVQSEGYDETQSHRLSFSEWYPGLKLSCLFLLAPLPFLGVFWLFGMRSGGWMFAGYMALLALEGWFVWRCVKDMCRYIMSGELDAAREDEQLMKVLNTERQADYLRDLNELPCSRN